MALALLVTCFSIGARPSYAASTTYTLTDLGTLGGESGATIARDINDAGQVVGQSQNASNQNQGFLWQNDGLIKMKPIGTLGGQTSPARGINKDGQVVGFSRISSTNTQLRAYLAQNGSPTSLGTLTYLSDSGTPTTYSNSEAWSINDDGQVVGRSFNDPPQGQPTTNGRAVLWAKGQTSNPKDLREFLKTTYSEVTYSEAWSINNLDQVVGEVGVADQQAKAFLYDDNTGKVTDIDAAGRQDPDHPVFPYKYSEAMAINDHGQVVGWSYRTTINDPPSTPPGPEGKAFLYEKGADGTATVRPLNPLDGDFYSRARDVDEFGRAVGWSRGTYGNEREQFSAVLWKDEQVTDLNDLIPANSRWRHTGDGKISGWKLTDAYAINKSGQIVGVGFKDGKDENLSQLRAFLLTPDTTEPKIECGSPDNLWHNEDVIFHCMASDDGVDLADPADASFTLTTNVSEVTETTDASTDSREVCDAAGNCATAGPIGGMDRLHRGRARGRATIARSWRRRASRTSGSSRRGSTGEDARDFLRDREGIDADAIAPAVDGKFMSAFVRARKPLSRSAPLGFPARFLIHSRRRIWI